MVRKEILAVFEGKQKGTITPNPFENCNNLDLLYSSTFCLHKNFVISQKLIFMKQILCNRYIYLYNNDYTYFENKIVMEYIVLSFIIYFIHLD